MTVSAAFVTCYGGFLSSLVLSLGGRGAGMSRRIAVSTATAAGSSIRAGSPCRMRDRRASSAPAWRMAARSSALITAGRCSSSVGGGVVWPHRLSGVTDRVRPRARPWRVCVPTRAGAREAVDGPAVTGRHRPGGAAHVVAGPCRGAPERGRRLAARPARTRVWSAPRARPARARGAGSTPSCVPCRTRPSGR